MRLGNVGDVDTASPRDIIMESRTGKLQRINELHTSYLGYQYPLLFPYGEDGYRHDISHCDSLALKRNRLTIREWFCFRIQTRQCEPMTILKSRRLFQQFVVDGYTMIESERLSFIKNNQSKLRGLTNTVTSVNQAMIATQKLHKKENVLCFHLALLVVGDLWINYILMGWQYVVM